MFWELYPRDRYTDVKSSSKGTNSRKLGALKRKWDESLRDFLLRSCINLNYRRLVIVVVTIPLFANEQELEMKTKFTEKVPRELLHDGVQAERQHGVFITCHLEINVSSRGIRVETLRLSERRSTLNRCRASRFDSISRFYRGPETAWIALKYWMLAGFVVCLLDDPPRSNDGGRNVTGVREEIEQDQVPDEIKIIEATVSNTMCASSRSFRLRRTDTASVYLQTRKNEMFPLGYHHLRNHKIVLDFEFSRPKMFSLFHSTRSFELVRGTMGRSFEKWQKKFDEIKWLTS